MHMLKNPVFSSFTALSQEFTCFASKSCLQPVKVRAEDYLIRQQPSPWVNREGNVPYKLHPAMFVSKGCLHEDQHKARQRRIC